MPQETILHKLFIDMKGIIEEMAADAKLTALAEAGINAAAIAA